MWTRQPFLRREIVLAGGGQTGEDAFPRASRPSIHATAAPFPIRMNSTDPVPLPAFAHKPAPYRGPALEEVMRLRHEHLNPALFHYYGEPLMIVEGRMQYLFDETGRRYLDGFGGIVTVSAGHCHPAVVAALNAQNARLQHATTIYAHPVIAEYAKALADKLPGGLKVCYFVNSGSEANDLALLMARLHTGNWDMIALRNGYHGGSQSTMGMTSHHTWKFNIPHGFGIHHAVAPDLYRGRWTEEDSGPLYAGEVADLIAYATPGKVAGFVAESVQGVGGVVVFPRGYLAGVYGMVRAAGGVCIADEVQTGFGRTGTHYWGFETQGVVPDIVTMAKGIGNGFPLAAVVTTPAIAESLASRIHFNTFGGNPMACAQGRAVLDVIDREGLQANALARGAELMRGLRALGEKHPVIGQIRGAGLMLGIELVNDRTTKAPSGKACAHTLEACRRLGLLLGKGGLHGNVLRITPPMCITSADTHFILDVLDRALPPG
jgi:alanine-glyoxylate transaminase / (R)-3-amino-2-methylpropionate-pyruvate transaminase